MLDGEAGVLDGFSHNDPHHEVCIVCWIREKRVTAVSRSLPTPR